ncbi:afadin isoform X1 [Scophthalmus maximus]|uniref:afadin isoform X1 n=1 Tax=Scophthalmus maximus TaxID=52904 RepID=UPI001FA8FA65|nr:afadin isoform X1 [Scophthalmus maximus]XP_035467401.2 afadin isoform X1 [Scophthalmus maximus]XP_047193619.1 afadin isoform X1 [Scophthalmus maximus]
MPEEERRERLAKVIRQWNNNRLDLFKISEPDENLDFHGVMRFYFEDHVGGSVATKCLRVCSNSSTLDVIDVLSEKFRPDMKMLTTSYSLYEVDAKKERKLEQEERPLIVQLNWNSDQKEERFVLKRDKESFQENGQEKEREGMIQKFKRTLSRKEKKSIIKAHRISDDEDWSTEKPRSLCVSNRDTEDCTEDKKHQWQSAPGVRLSGSLHQDFPDQPGLPFGIEFSDNSEDAFLSAVINYANSSTVHFKLSPAYILYAAGHFALRCQRYRRGSTPSGQKHSVKSITNKMVAMTEKVIQRQESIAGALAFWMANASELLNFFKHDRDLRLLTQQSQLDLPHLVHKAYRFLLQCLQNELAKHLPTFLIDPEQHGPLPAGIELVLNTLMNTMSMLSRHRVNPALTIQLFSRLFHFISIWLFNQLMSPEADAPGLRSHYWGAALRQRLTAIEAWAERHGLELAADVHLGHIIQATTLLTMNKYSMQDLKDIQNTCFKLNSVQLKMLLTGYFYANTEPHIPLDLIDAVVTAVEASADNRIRSEGRDIQLEESLDLCLPFLVPEGGYSCDIVRGIPPGLREFLEPICQKGLCSLTSESNSKGDWTIYFHEDTLPAERTYLAAHTEPEIVTITLRKPLNSGMGLSIVAAKGAEQGNLGIYIKSVVKGGPAEMNGMLKSGDQLLSVDGQSLVGLSQERAAAIIGQTGPVVTLKVEKFGASYHGLGALLGEPAPERITGEKSFPKPNGEAFELYSAVEAGPSQQLHERSSSRWNKEQIMQRNRQLYRSDPNMTTDRCLRDEPADPVVRGNKIAADSSINICTDTFHRDYSTLPNPKSQGKNISESSRPQQTFESLRPLDGKSSSKKIYVRQALSQENLCGDSGGPLLDKRRSTCEQQGGSAKQRPSHYSSFPIRSCVSSHDILSDNSSPARGAGVWRLPFSQHSTSTTSVQPKRIDVPLTRAANTQPNPPLVTFQRPSLLSMNQANNIYACPIPATEKLPQLSLSSQQHRSSMFRGQAVKLQVNGTPKKHVSFQEPPTQQEQGTAQPSEPRRRETQEKLEEKQQRLPALELLKHTVQELQAKVTRSAEENERLHKLRLEWQFQRRLQEIQQRNDDEDEHEDFDRMVTIQQQDTSAQSSGGNINGKLKELEKLTGNPVSQKEDRINIAQRRTGLTENVHNVATKQNREEKIQSMAAPEKLTFRERQRLFLSSA